MRFISGNHLKFFLVNTRHNLFHWLVVVLIRLFYSLILVPLSVYFVAIGFLLSENTTQSALPEIWFEKITFYSSQLPYFQQIERYLIAQLGHWYKDAPVWWTIVVGIPLILIGLSLFFSNFFSLYYSIFSLRYNRTHCPFCKEPIEIKTG